VYSGHLLKQQLGSDCDEFLAANTDLWLAQYTDDQDDISWPDETYPQWTLWQYSETGQVPGIDDSYVDFNNFNGDEEAFLDWISATGVMPQPPEPPEPDDRSLVTVAITAPENVKIGVTINDRKVVRPKRRGLLKTLRAARRGPDITR
jgi:lysozyme